MLYMMFSVIHTTRPTLIKTVQFTFYFMLNKIPLASKLCANIYNKSFVNTILLLGCLKIKVCFKFNLSIIIAIVAIWISQHRLQGMGRVGFLSENFAYTILL